MQIQYNITRIEEWCKSHDMPEGTLQLEELDAFVAGVLEELRPSR